MSKRKHKMRLVWWMITREAVIILVGIMIVSFISAIVTVINPVKCKTISSYNNITTNQSCIVPKYQPKTSSTMELMVTGKEIGKGDYVRKAQLKEIKRRKREAERKRKEKEKKLTEKNFLESLNTKENIYILEHLCNGEAGDQNDECQQAVIWVVLNRVKSKYFPDTVEGVVFAHMQYACTWDGNYNKKPSERVKKNVQAVLSGKSCIKVPENVVYQAQFEQGSGLWRQIGTETFCYM